MPVAANRPGGPFGLGRTPSAPAFVATASVGSAECAEWAGLADALAAPPWLYPEWIVPWWDAFGRDPVEVVAVRRQGVLVALAAVRRRGRDVLSPVGGWTPEFGVLATDRDAEALLADELLSRTGGRLELRHVAGEASMLETTRARARRAGFVTRDRRLFGAPYAAFGEDGWAGYEQGRSSERLRKLRRAERELSRQGRLEYEFLRGCDALDRVEEALGIEALGWKGEAGVAVLSDPRRHRVFLDSIERGAARGWLVIGFLRLDGRAIAFDLALDSGTTSWGWKTGYDPAFARWSPGIQVQHEALRRASERGIRRVEFFGPQQPYKLAWATGMRDIAVLQAFAPTLRGRLGHLAWTRGRPAVKRVRRALGRGPRTDWSEA